MAIKKLTIPCLISIFKTKKRTNLGRYKIQKYLFDHLRVRSLVFFSED